MIFLSNHNSHPSPSWGPQVSLLLCSSCRCSFPTMLEKESSETVMVICCPLVVELNILIAELGTALKSVGEVFQLIACSKYERRHCYETKGHLQHKCTFIQHNGEFHAVTCCWTFKVTDCEEGWR